MNFPALTQETATHTHDLRPWRHDHVFDNGSHDAGLTAPRVRTQLAQHEEIVHSTIEVHYCMD